MKFLNGYKNPKFLILDKSFKIVDTISLELCDEDGLIEEILPLSVKQIGWDFNEDTKPLGIHIVFNLSYSFSDKTNTKKIISLINYYLGGYTLKLFPRSDIYQRSFFVNYLSDSFTLALAKGGYFAKGHKKIKLQFKTKEKLNNILYIDPDFTPLCAALFHNRTGIFVTLI
ncbi:MAG: hypothetical protein FJ216_07380 [Ignavibacteria bacterium]|nr:hypothetical protein [Ignavibacteria bacterium]